MTHTLNRRGLSEERPGEEIVFLSMVHQKEKQQKLENMRELAITVLKYKPDNIIGAPVGLKDEDIVTLCSRAGIVTAVFNNKDDVLNLVREIKSKKLGISVVLSGLFGDVRGLCKATELKEHTHHISLGIFGRKEKLPDDQTLEITTQCGHALISPHHVEHVVKQINKGKMTYAEGAGLLIKPCVCGIGNVLRTERILGEMTGPLDLEENPKNSV